MDIIEELGFAFDAVFRPSRAARSGRWRFWRALAWYYALATLAILLGFLAMAELNMASSLFATVAAAVLLPAPPLVALGATLSALLGVALGVPLKRFRELLACFTYALLVTALAGVALMALITPTREFTNPNMEFLAVALAAILVAFGVLCPIADATASISARLGVGRWRALVMSAVVLLFVLAVIFASLYCLGVFRQGGVAVNCIAAPGYYCAGVVYPHSMSVIHATIGQAPGTTNGAWGANVYAVLVPQGTQIGQGGVPDVPAADVVLVSNSSVMSGVEELVALPTGLPPAEIGGTPIGGSIWVCYGGGALAEFDQISNCNYAQIAVLTVKPS
jgi:hypothetical protein